MTIYDNTLTWLKNNKIISFFMILGALLIAVASVTDAVSKIISISTYIMNPVSTSHKICKRKIYKQIKDANRCGTKPSVITISPASPKKCTDNSFGRSGWKYNKRMRATCEWGFPRDPVAS